MGLEPGRTISNYEILGALGAGGMGQVYRARDTRLDREVALKVLPDEFTHDPERMARFEREARVLASLRHPNIVTVHSIERADGVHFLSMELVEGRTLAESVRPGGMALADFYPLARSVVDALQAAHARGVTHRDVKPENIVVDTTGRPFVVDFGIARVQRPDAAAEPHLTVPGAVVGTVPYMAPEALRGREADSRSDLFSMGVVLYEVLTGVHPFRADDPAECISSILRDTPRPADEVRPDVPPALSGLLARCLEKDPDARLQSALELRRGLEAIANAAAKTAALPAAPALLSRWGAAAAAVVLAALAVAGGWWAMRDDAPPRLHPRQMTTTQVFESSPTFSPSGEQIAFGRMTSGNLDLYLQSAAGGPATLLVGGPGDETSPRWSRDGAYIAYVCTEPGGTPVQLISPDRTTARWLIDTNARRFDFRTHEAVLGDQPWSKDSRSLLVSRIGADGCAAIHRVDRDSAAAVRLSEPPDGCDDLGASYSPDGATIVFWRRQHDKGDLMLMDADGRNVRLLLKDGNRNRAPSWRRDGRTVVYQSNDGGQDWQLWEIDVGSERTRQIHSDTHSVNGSTVSVDDRIAYVSFHHDTVLTLLDPATGDWTPLTEHSRDNFGPRFSPDGTRVAYHSDRTGDAELWILPLDGGRERRVTESAGADIYPDWSPDGQRLVFVSSRDGEPKLCTVKYDGSDVRLLLDMPVSQGFSPGQDSHSSRWSPDDVWIGFIVKGPAGKSLWVVRPTGRDARHVLDGVTGFDWYLDGRRLLCTLGDRGEDLLIAYDLETGETRELWSGPHTEIDVAPDGRSVTLCTGRGHMSMGLAQLALDPPEVEGGLPRRRGEPVDLVRSRSHWHVHHGGWSLDGKRMVFVQDTDHSNIYELVESE